MNIYHAEIELGGETRTLECHFEIEDHGLPFIYNAVMVTRTCPADGIWYDSDGKANDGPHDENLSVTVHLSKAQLNHYAAEIQQYLLDQSVDFSHEERLIEQYFKRTERIAA